jgi:hypothetical protein
MKIELKHVKGYLDTEAKVRWIREDNKEVIISELNISDYHFLIRINKGKLVLRPLSELTKEINNGFTYIDLLRSEFDKNSRNGFNFYYLQETPLEYPFNIIQKLLEWHFDIYGLIENGLAIDINTL